MEKEALISKPTTPPELEPLTVVDKVVFTVAGLLVISAIIGFFIGLGMLIHNLDVIEAQKAEEKEYAKKHALDITIPSMDFTVLKITVTRLSVKWDLTIRIPGNLPGFYTCLEGDLQVFIVYKGVTIATSPTQSYNLKPWWPKLLKLSLVVSEEDMDGVIVKDIMKDVTRRDDMRFGSRLILPDCRKGTSGKMNYACDEATLRFEPGSQRNASLFDNQPICHYLP